MAESLAETRGSMWVGQRVVRMAGMMGRTMVEQKAEKMAKRMVTRTADLMAAK